MNQERTKRKLSGILSADVAGYSRLMEEDEEFTIRCLEEYKKVIGELIEEYKGRVVDAPGDNILAEFSSVVNAIDCAVNIQNKLQIKNSRLSEKSRMDFRIGVNLGDVIDEEGRIYGDGVNIAARIEGLAEPGGISISGTAYDQVKTKLGLGYEYLGEHNLKNITGPVRVYRLLTGAENAGKVIGEKRLPGKISRRIAMSAIIILFLAAAGSTGWLLYSHKSVRTEPASLDRMAFAFPNINSIAVLPFDNLSDDKGLDNFSKSLTDELITGLSKHPDLFITTRDSSFETETPEQVRENAGVRYILKGKVRGDSNKVRITAQLVEAAQEYNIWTDAYDREINNNTLAVQSDIMWRIFREIRIRLVDMNQTPDFLPVNRNDIEYIETFHLLYRYYKTNPFDPGRFERLQMALDLADKLINIDPDPWVYFMKGSILIALSNYKDSKSENYLKDAQGVASEVEKIDKGASLGITAQIYISKNELERALDCYKEWVALSPDSKNARFGAGYTFLLQKKYGDAVEQYEAGLKIDQRPESQNFVFLGIAYSHPTAKGFSNLEKAKENLGKALRPPSQNNFFAHLFLTLIFTYENQMENARFNANEMLRIRPFFSIQDYPYRSWASTGQASDDAITRFHKELLKKAGIPERKRLINF